MKTILHIEEDTETGAVLAAYLEIGKGAVHHVQETDGVAVNYNARGQILGVEILGPFAGQPLKRPNRCKPL